MKSRNFRAFAVPTALACCVLLAPAAASAAPISCWTISKFVSRYLDNHIRHHKLSPELKQRTIDVFLRSFDPSQSALIRSEVEALRVELLAGFDTIEAGSCRR